MSGHTGAAPAWRSTWIPWAFVAFFGVVLLANTALILVAVQTWTGLETGAAYQRGLAYNRALAAARAQDALDWEVAFHFSQAGARHGRLRLTLQDRHGDLIEDARVEARFMRPTHEGYDRVVDVPYHHGGEYRAEVELPLPGQWDVFVSASARGQTWRLSERVHLRP